ncbi:hypothetical protein N431DRAFT_397868 [Stipitochalara longipes BDJ]|nr:hypothetical protein N431DRAFT_397868 [Stipitochalara longipes BDJ]
MDGNFSFFALPDHAGTPPEKLQVDTEGNPLRKRQPHRKSRYGCATCKQRKVKCDETTPACLNCTKRNLQCSFKTPLRVKDVHPKRRIQATPNTGSPQIAPSGSLVLLDRRHKEHSEVDFSCIYPFSVSGRGVEVKDFWKCWQTAHRGPYAGLPQIPPIQWLQMLEKHSRDHRGGVACPTCFARAGIRPEDRIEELNDMEDVTPFCNLIELVPNISPTEKDLLLHFEEFTSENLALSTSLWRTVVLRTALKCDFVKNAVLLVATAHKNHYSDPHHHSREVDLQYVSSTLSGLRSALNSEMTAANFEAIISATILFVHYVWAQMEQELNGDIDIALCFRQTSDHFHGLKDCIIVAQDVFMQTNWARVLLYSPRVNLERYLMESIPMSDKLERIFLHCTECGLGARMTANASENNMCAIRRLIIVLNVICISSPDIESSGLLPDIHRYLFTWPTSGRWSTKGFILQVGEGNPASLTILLYYYAAILRVYTKKIWWMRDGATKMFNKLRSKLDGHCSRCIDIPLSLLAVPEQHKATGCNL